MPRQYQIKWRKQDIAEINRLIENFNKKIAYHLKKNPEAALYLPQKLSKKEVISNITTRADFNRVVNSLKRFGKRGAEKLVVSPGGVMTTAWEKKETAIRQGIVNRKKKKKLEKLSPSTEKGTMGTVKEHDLKPQKFNWKTGKQKDWERFKESVFKQAYAKYEKKKAEQYLKNYKKAVDNNLGTPGQIVKTVASKAGGLWLYDAYALNQDLQIDFVYGQEAAEVITARIMDAFATQGFTVTDAQIGTDPLSTGWRKYSSFYAKGKQELPPQVSGMEDFDDWDF